MGRHLLADSRVAAAVLVVSLQTWPARPARADADASAAPSALIETPGPAIVYGARPALGAELAACSFRVPLCVHAPEGTDPGAVLRALDSAERAHEASSWGLRLPEPDVDATTGALDLYLVPGVPGGARAELGARDDLGGFDRASAFLLVDAGLAGCALDVAVARETARAVLFRSAPATDPTTARAETSYLGRLMAPCALEAPLGVDVFQAHPEASVAGTLDPLGRDDAASSEYADGAALFYWWLDFGFGVAPGDIVRALWALAPTTTAIGAPAWSGHPNGFDVLRTTFKNALTSGSTLDDLLLEFAVARAFVGSGADDQHMPETRALGDAGRPHIAWAIGWPRAPRSLASGRGVAPTGAAYVEVDASSAPKGARLRFEARWEEHAQMRWAAVKVDANGHELGAVAIASPPRGTEASFTVVDLDGVARVLFVGANVGDPSWPFHPDDRSPEPHGWVADVAAEAP